jgi:acetyl-CoA carboxylase carboxyltransferase component
MAFEKEMEELNGRKEKALQMGGPEKIKRQHDQGKFTAQERISRLLDPDSFFEVGMLNCSDMPGMEDKTPADSKVAGFGKIDGRTIAIVAKYFTVLAATSSRVAGRKDGEVKLQAVRRGFPVICLGEAASIPSYTA